LCDAGDLASRFAHAQSGGGRKAHRPQSLRTFLQYFLEGLDLFGNRDEAALERSTSRTYFSDRQQEYRCVAELGNFRPLPQGTPAFERAVIGKKHFVVQGILPSTEQGILDRYPSILPGRRFHCEVSGRRSLLVQLTPCGSRLIPVASTRNSTLARSA